MLVFAIAFSLSACGESNDPGATPSQVSVEMTSPQESETSPTAAEATVSSGSEAGSSKSTAPASSQGSDKSATVPQSGGGSTVSPTTKGGNSKSTEPAAVSPTKAASGGREEADNAEVSFDDL